MTDWTQLPNDVARLISSYAKEFRVKREEDLASHYTQHFRRQRQPVISTYQDTWVNAAMRAENQQQALPNINDYHQNSEQWRRERRMKYAAITGAAAFSLGMTAFQMTPKDRRSKSVTAATPDTVKANALKSEL